MSIAELKEKLARFQKLDREAATYVESQIAMFDEFTGEPPYVGWDGLGLALKEHLASLEAALAIVRKSRAETFVELDKVAAEKHDLEATLAKATALLAPLAEFEIDTPEEMADFRDDYRQEQRTRTQYFKALQKLAKASGITVMDAIKAAEASNTERGE